MMAAARRERLVERRLEFGLSQENVAEALDVAVGAVARWERGISVPRPCYRGPLAELLQITLPELQRLLKGSDTPPPSGHAVPGWLDHYAKLEQGAARLQTFEPITIPGLLQTPAYVEAVMRANWQPLSDQAIQQRVDARISRQAVLKRKGEPLEVCCVLDESVLTRMSSRFVMAEQLDHLIRVIALPTVQVQVCPAMSNALHMTPFGSFGLFTSPGASSPDIVCTEDLTGFNYLDRPAAIEAHVELFEYLTAMALSPDQSAQLIKEAVENIR